MPDDDLFTAPRKLTHDQARREQLLHASGQSIPERLAACAALTRELLRMRGIDLNESEADLTPRRISRRPR